MDENIKAFFKKVSAEFHKYLHHTDFKAVVLKDTDKFTRFSIGKELNTRFENETKAWQENHINVIFQRSIVADLMEKFEIIHITLHYIKDNLKGFKTPSSASRAGVICSFLVQRLVSNPGFGYGLVTVGILSGIVLGSLELVDGFDTVRRKAFQTRRDVFTKKEIQSLLKKEHYDGIQEIIKNFLEGDLEEEIKKIEENKLTMENEHGFFKSKIETLSSLQSIVVMQMERLQQIERINIKPV